MPTCLCPQYRFTVPPAAVRKVNSLPYTPLVVVDGTSRSGHNLSPLHVPPYGIVVMDVTFAAGPADPLS